STGSSWPRPSPPPLQLAIVHHQAGHAAAMASRRKRWVSDSCASGRSVRDASAAAKLLLKPPRNVSRTGCRGHDRPAQQRPQGRPGVAVPRRTDASVALATAPSALRSADAVRGRIDFLHATGRIRHPSILTAVAFRDTDHDVWGESPQVTATHAFRIVAAPHATNL